MDPPGKEGDTRTRQGDRHGTIRYDLDLAAGHRPSRPASLGPLRTWNSRLRPGSGVARPAGGTTGAASTCAPNDGQPTNRIVVTLPFLWLG